MRLGTFARAAPAGLKVGHRLDGCSRRRARRGRGALRAARVEESLRARRATGLPRTLSFLSRTRCQASGTPSSVSGSALENGRSMRLLIPLFLFLSACRTTLEPSDYARECSVDSDCVAVAVGNLCAPCASPQFTPSRVSTCSGANSAINLREVARYNADYKAVRGACLPDLTACPAACPPSKEAFCSSGTCALRPSSAL